MSENLQAKGEEFAKYLESLSPDEKTNLNNRNIQNAESEYSTFKDHFTNDNCYLCSKPLTWFSTKTPCPHWLLKPKGFSKSNFPEITKLYGFFQIQSFLRWVANQDGFAKNINDIPEEGTGNKLFEVTIKYKNLEWAFSCAESDYKGHPTSQHGKHQHYHFQMRIDKRQFINYSDFHVPFSHMDIINIEAGRSSPHQIKQQFTFGEGMKDVLNDETVEHIVKGSIPANEDSENDAPFKFDIIATAEEGKLIAGEDIYALIQEAKRKGVTISSLMHTLPNAQSQIIVSPGPGVVNQAPRSSRNRNA